MISIQHLVMPSLMFNAPEEMYLRLRDAKVSIRLNEKSLKFQKGGHITVDTFFNGVTVSTWKKNCPIKDLNLILSGQGKFIIRFGLHKIADSHRWLSEQEIEINNQKPSIIELPFWSNIKEGLLYFSLESIEDDSEITGGFYATNTPPINQVKLGIVITHFNRKQYVLPAIKRIRDELLNDFSYKDKIELIVVDNSQNITNLEAQGITLIPNQNLGGSGGFTRGFLHLKDEGTFTHCLFMDDDASCEIESIRRAFNLFQFAIEPKFAISGSLLRELEPFRLVEKGAQFDGFCKFYKSGLDMRQIHDLLVAEVVDNKSDYGAWWFFGYKIEDVNVLAFPFFVRGDDILFGRLNQFNITTQNAIGCWGEDFALKNGPMTRYLDLRNHLIQNCIGKEYSLLFLAKLITQFFITALFSYNYASAKAARLAVNHVLQGPKFWEENIDMIKVRESIGAFSDLEKMRKIDITEVQVDFAPMHESLFRKLIRILSINGFLIPNFLLKDRHVFQPKGFRTIFRQAFGYKRILYIYEPESTGYIAEHNKREIISELILFLITIFKFSYQFPSIRKKYQREIPSMTSEKFWRDVYSNKFQS